MSGIATRQSDLEAEFQAIERAVRETERGRWFLGEFARRNRHADTEMLLAAIARIERSVGAPRDGAGSDAAGADTGKPRASISQASMSQPDVDGFVGADGGRDAEAVSGPRPAEAAAVDEILFSEPAPPPPPPTEAAVLQLVGAPPSEPAQAEAAAPAGDPPAIEDALRKMRAGQTLSSDEAAKALDTLQGLSLDERARIFS